MQISTADVSRVSTLRAAYAGGLSTHVVVDAVLERLAARGDDSVWISRFDAAALHARAAAIEVRFPPEARPPLYGVPFAVKDQPRPVRHRPERHPQPVRRPGKHLRR